MTHHLTTTHEDTITYDHYGSGPVLIFIAGAGPFRATDPITTLTAQLAADQGLTTIVYDRIGRGDSTGDTPIGLNREIVALQALIDTIGHPVTLCGHSSGSAIALHAADAGLLINGLAVWEIPIIGSTEAAQRWATQFFDLLDAQNHVGAIEEFTQDMPPDFRASLKNSPMWDILVNNAPSLRADVEALVWFHSAPCAQLLANVTVPVLTMVGETTFEVMHHASNAIADALPNATKVIVPGAQHGWEPTAMATRLAQFVLTQT